MKKIICIFFSCLIVFTLAVIPASASSTESYPFPDCSSLIKDKNYILWLSDMGEYRLVTFSIGTKIYLRSFNNGTPNYYFSDSSTPATSSMIDPATYCSETWGNKMKFYYATGDSWVQYGQTIVPMSPIANTRQYYSSTLLTAIPREGTGSSFYFFTTTLLIQSTFQVGSIVQTRDFSAVFSAVSGNLSILLLTGLVILAILLGISLIPRVISFFKS